MVAVPFYIVFGRRKFFGYRSALNQALKKHQDLVETAREEFAPFNISDEELGSELCKSMARINRWGFSKGNKFELLIDGMATFDSIINGIAKAKDYILVQFFIVRSDNLGNRLKDALIAKAEEGVRVYFLYDEVGSYALKREYIGELRRNGVEVEAFGTTRGKANRFQINFRNHRKIVVVDGVEAYVGGHNVGDEYLGKSKRYSHWRDTHVRIQGPAALECQAVFLMDWHWATSDVPKVNTTPKPVEGGHPALISPMGPAEEFEICEMIYQALISNARERIWISSPYLVPNRATLVALQFAAKRGVDVRIMIPKFKDHLLVYLAGFSYYETLTEAGIKVLRYHAGFLHQKAVLIDDKIAGIGTVNLDQRAFHLNFEVMAFCTDPEFVKSTSEMLAEDMENCELASGDDYYSRGLAFRISVRIARMFSPLL